MLVGPDVGAVRRDEDRHVADQLDTARVGVLAQGVPLAVEAPLAEAPEAAGLGQFLRSFGEGAGAALGKGRGPVLPDLAVRAEFSVEGHEQGVIIEPVAVLGAEIGEVGLRITAHVGEKAFRGAVQARQAVGAQGRVVDLVGAEVRPWFELGRAQPAGGKQAFEVDEQFVAGERRRAHVRRVARADAAER